eukprot:10596859-Alexandrium_andersonii.AAC.1
MHVCESPRTRPEHHSLRSVGLWMQLREEWGPADIARFLQLDLAPAAQLQIRGFVPIFRIRGLLDQIKHPNDVLVRWDA